MWHEWYTKPRINKGLPAYRRVVRVYFLIALHTDWRIVLAQRGPFHASMLVQEVSAMIDHLSYDNHFTPTSGSSLFLLMFAG